MTYALIGLALGLFFCAGFMVGAFWAARRVNRWVIRQMDGMLVELDRLKNAFGGGS